MRVFTVRDPEGKLWPSCVREDESMVKRIAASVFMRNNIYDAYDGDWEAKWQLLEVNGHKVVEIELKEKQNG